MDKIKKQVRIIILSTILLIGLICSFIMLMKIQIVEGQSLYARSLKSSSGNQDVIAPRGEILDINGTALVANKVTFDVIIEYALFSKDKQEQNKIILELASFLEKNGVKWEDNLPVTYTYPFEYTDQKEKMFNNVMKNLNVNVYATADNCVTALIDKYDISDSYTNEEKRIIAGIRYEMIYQGFSMSTRYTFAKDISKDTVMTLKEMTYKFPGSDIVETAERIYPDGTIFPHGLGTTGPIYKEEYASLKEKGYKLNDKVGKDGLEKSMEDWLRGKNGVRTVLTGSNGEITSIEDTVPAVPGNNVVLTIDSTYQKKVQDMLEAYIKNLQETAVSVDKGKECKAGAVVVLDAKTGAVKALASYPGYDLNDYKTKYDELKADPAQPLFNRALQGSYRPGSTFKPLVATAALSEKVIDENSIVHCGGVYEFYGFQPKCFTGPHGDINVVRALDVSCNIFFYEMGRRLTINRLAEYETKFGFGTDLKFELQTRKGYIATPETFAEHKWDWDAGQVLMAAIGQSEISATPLNLGVMAQTIANDGHRMRPHIVDSIVSFDGSNVTKTEATEDATITDTTGKVFSTVKKGMMENARSLSNFPGENTPDLPLPAATKTGTPQNGSKLDSCCIGFYPAEDPQIAFAIVLDGGYFAKGMAKKLIAEYLNLSEVVQDEQITNAQ